MFSKCHSLFIYSYDKMKDFIIKPIPKTVITIKRDGNLKTWCEIAVLVGNTKFCYKQWKKNEMDETPKKEKQIYLL